MPSGGTQTVGGRTSCGPPTGFSLIEVTVAMALVALGTAMSAPALAASVDAGRARHAAQFVAAQCRDARMQAVARSAATGLVFTQSVGQWTFARCLDGNANGIRRTDIARATDRCDPAVDLSFLFSGVTISVDASLPDPDGGPGATDPVRFGASDIASFAPSGTATAGTLYLRSAGGVQLAVRVAGVTGRTRILRWDARRRQWQEV